MHIFQFWSVLLAFVPSGLGLTHTSRDSTSVDTVPDTVASGISKVDFISGSSGVDAPKVVPITSPVWEWWYFDAVSTDGESSFIMAFFTTTNVSFPLLPVPDVISVWMWATFPNGTVYNSNPVIGKEAIIISEGNGASGVWEGTGFSWAGKPDVSEYIVSIDSPGIGVTGDISFKSVAPSRYPCSPAKAGQQMQFMPHLGWASAIPDADAVVNLKVNGDTLNFQGLGYHDMNWGDVPFAELVDSWYWGHTRLGPYSVVWFDGIDINGEEHTNGYVARDGQIISVSCNGTKARPTGANSLYPPVAGASDPPSAFHIEIDMGDLGVMVVDVEVKTLLFSLPGLFDRWIGVSRGGLKGKDVFESGAFFEQFTLAS